MKRFIKNLLIYVFVVLLIVVPIDIYRIRTKKYVNKVIGSSIYCAIAKSKTPGKGKKLLLGDSVGRQMYKCENEYDSIVSLACNQAITLAGHYFLLRNYIESNIDNLPTEVILFYSPFSLSNDVDKHAYHYFLKPFPPFEYSEWYTEHLTQRIHTIPLYWTANLPLIKTSAYTPVWAVPSSMPTESISQLSYEYLLKMDSITKANNIRFHLVSVPIRDDRQDDIESFWENIPTAYLARLEDLLQPYKESVVYYPSKWYFDEYHFFYDKIPYDYLGLF
jgi:hypothetical protein